jgi:hypothetical protein
MVVRQIHSENGPLHAITVEDHYGSWNVLDAEIAMYQSRNWNQCSAALSQQQ